MRYAMQTGKEMPYAKVFDEALREAVVDAAPGDDRRTAMRKLLQEPSARQAHPTFEHLLPIHVAAGAAGDDVGKRLWTMTEMSAGWAQYRFGDVPEKEEA